ncbi:MAG: hypothetical protein J5J04_00725 [Anaerolineae bacterium]|nr:hypothetical protein [Chloroflexota bacterium]MCO6442588.1 hypothetical protein [Anaerolineae bacterium]NOG51134.1 hypothetical protein [Chloroflexota bacterium]GIK26951.1 MAG: hypothetical protein BroJett007_00890 [Chloroflexota bacterium]
MNTIQKQVMDLLEAMDESQQSAVLEYAHYVIDGSTQITLAAYLEQALRFRRELEGRPQVSSAAVLDQLRDERDGELLDALKRRY